MVIMSFPADEVIYFEINLSYQARIVKTTRAFKVEKKHFSLFLIALSCQKLTPARERTFKLKNDVKKPFVIFVAKTKPRTLFAGIKQRTESKGIKPRTASTRIMSR